MTLDPRALEAELHRRIPTARRAGWRVSWEQWPGPQHQSGSITGLTDEVLADLAEAVFAELARRVEGPITIAGLLARWEQEAKAG
jgi:hypothetical protein